MDHGTQLIWYSNSYCTAESTRIPMWKDDTRCRQLANYSRVQIHGQLGCVCFHCSPMSIQSTKCARILLAVVSWNHALFSGLLLIMRDNSNSIKVDRISAWHWLTKQSKNVWEAKFPKCQQWVPGMFLDQSLCITGSNLATGTVWPPSFSFNSHSLCLSSWLGRFKK